MGAFHKERSRNAVRYGVNEGFHVPLFSYFLIVGSVLSGLLFYADSVMALRPLPFITSQSIGLPESYKVPVVAVKDSKPEIIVVRVEPSDELKKPVKAVRKQDPTRVVGQPVPQDRYAAYPTHEHGRIW